MAPVLLNKVFGSNLSGLDKIISLCFTPSMAILLPHVWKFLAYPFPLKICLLLHLYVLSRYLYLSLAPHCSALIWADFKPVCVCQRKVLLLRWICNRLCSPNLLLMVLVVGELKKIGGQGLKIRCNLEKHTPIDRVMQVGFHGLKLLSF